MDQDELVRSIEARLAQELELAKTLVKSPRSTIEPQRPAGPAGEGALEALRGVAGSLEGRLERKGVLGEGGMGVVHEATQLTLGRPVAVKTLRAGAGDHDAALRMLREAWVTGALEHPNIVPIYDVGVDAQGAPIIMMKRVEGRPWSEVMHRPDELARRLGADDPLEANARIFVAVCNAIHFAHSRGVLHRDIKPENVMLGAFGEVYVLDWGIAVSLRPDPSGRLPLPSREVAGTPSYMAPEMLLGDPAALSPRTDVYLLGAIFYEIFAGEPPHTGANLQAMIGSIVVSKPRFADRFPAEARRICERALARDPEQRFESAEALRSAVEEYLRHRGSRKLAWDAKQSLGALLRTLQEEPPSEERSLAVFNLLGECRFGYRAALSAWPGNEAARRGLDRALLAVIEHELSDGDPQTAALLLREVSEPQPEVAARAEAALKARADKDEQLRRLGEDHDPAVGARTRTLVMAIFGTLWTATPLVELALIAHGGSPTHGMIIGGSAFFLALGLLLFAWARQTLSRTLLNRRLSATLGLHLVAQMVLSTGACAAAMTPLQSQTQLVFGWSLTQALMAVWVQPWLVVCAALCAASYVAASAWPSALYPLMALDNLVFTLALVKIWLPEGDIEQIKQRRAALRRQARGLFLDLYRRQPADEES